MNEDRLLGSVSMCRGAGKLKIGFDAVMEALLAGAPLVLIASDASQRTRGSISSAAIAAGARVLELERTQEQILNTVGRGFAVAAVTDENLAKLVCNNHGDKKEANL